MSASMTFGAHGAQSPSFSVLRFVSKVFGSSLSRAGAAQQRLSEADPRSQRRPRARRQRRRPFPQFRR